MATTNLTIRIDSDKRQAFEQLANQLGMSMNTAINVFINTAIRHNGLPFEVKVDPMETPEVVAKLQQVIAHADSPEAKFVAHKDVKKVLGLE